MKESVDGDGFMGSYSATMGLASWELQMALLHGKTMMDSWDGWPTSTWLVWVAGKWGRRVGGGVMMGTY